MSWIGLADHEDGRFAASGLSGKPGAAVTGELLTRGTLMFETQMSGQARPHALLGIANRFPYIRELTFRAIPGGGIALVHRDDNDIIHAAIRWAGDARAHTLRVTYAWDSDTGWARLALEQPERARAITTLVSMPRPQLLSDLRDMMLGQVDRILSPEVLFAALSSDIAPIGAMPSLHPDTPIATPHGYRAVGMLRRGDTVLTEGDKIVPVLHTVRNQVPARGSHAPVRLRAPYFGLTRDIVVAPEQRLVLRGSEVEYNFGQEAVLISARHVVNGYAATWSARSAVAEYVQLVLPGHEVLIAAGCAVESLYIGRLRRNSDRLAQSALSEIPSRLLPEHARPYHQVLRPFEAITLLDYRAA